MRFLKVSSTLKRSSSFLTSTFGDFSGSSR